MVEELHTDDTADVPFVAELREYGGGGASHGVFEIHAVGEVGSYARSVDNDIYPLGCHLPSPRFLIMQWDKHQQCIQDIGI